MRIAFVQFFDFPTTRAHGAQILHTAQSLASLGNEVFLFPRRKARGGAAFLLKEQYGFFPSPKLHLQPIGGSFKGLSSLLYRWHLLSFGRCSSSEDVFYVRHVRHGLWLNQFRHRLGWPMRIVYEFHNLQCRIAEEKGHLQRAEIFKKQEAAMVAAADAIVHISQPLADDVNKVFPNNKPQLILPDGVNLALFDGIGHMSTTAGQELSLIYAGSLYREKGVDCLLEMITFLPEEVKLTIVGGNDPDDLARLRSNAVEMKVSDRITFAGQVMPREVSAYLARADAIVIPAGPGVHSQRYTSPLKLFESMATGLPLVVARTDSMCSILRDNENALIASGLDGTSLAGAVKRLIYDRRQGYQIGQRARQDALLYGWDERARRLADFLLNLEPQT